MTPDLRASLTAFVAYAQTLHGDEKGEAQVFLDRLFIAFGHAPTVHAREIHRARFNAGFCMNS